MVGTVSTTTIRQEIAAACAVSTQPIPTQSLPTNEPGLPTKPPEPVKWDDDGLPLYGSVEAREAAREYLRATSAAEDEAEWLANRKVTDPQDLSDPFSAASIARRTYATLPEMGEDRETYRRRIEADHRARHEAAQRKTCERDRMRAAGEAVRLARMEKAL